MDDIEHSLPNIWLVQDFHEKFNVPIRDYPRLLFPDEHSFRANFIREELEEYERAYSEGNIVKQFDALIDLEYVIHGTALMHGFPTHLGFKIVHAANMRKEPGGSRHKTDVRKPEGWVPPEAELEQLLKKWGMR